MVLVYSQLSEDAFITRHMRSSAIRLCTVISDLGLPLSKRFLQKHLSLGMIYKQGGRVVQWSDVLVTMLGKKQLPVKPMITLPREIHS